MFNLRVIESEWHFIINCFFVYSFLGWLMECIVISFEQKCIVNRGFTKSPFCVIYGFGAFFVYAILEPVKDNLIILFLLGLILATFIEYMTAIVMMRIFGSIWWDYSKKPFNYKGMLCLESSVAWGVIAVLFFRYLHPFVSGVLLSYPNNISRIVAVVLLFVYMIDFIISFYNANNRTVDEEADVSNVNI